MLRVDFETRSTVDLPKCGVHIYAAHHTTDVWCMAYTFEDDDEPKLWVRGEPLPSKIRKYVADGGLVGAWNAAFELAIWNTIMTARYGWPTLKASQCRCTMMMAGAMSLPLGLDKCAEALAVGISKDKTGYGLMLRMSRPRNISEDGTPVWWDVASRKEILYAYCKQDVRVERKLAGKLRSLLDSEQELWELDQEINERGVPVDIESVAYAIGWCNKERRRLNKHINKITKGLVRDCSDVRGLQEYARVDSIAAAVLPEAIEAATGLRREALELRAAFAKTSTKKLDAFLIGTADDGRMRGIFQFYGAPSTGRWAGRRVQPQNLPRPKCSQKEIERRISEKDYKSLSEVSDCIRSMIASEDGELVCADFSSIEARVLAWMAEQDDVIDVFLSGGDIYKHEAVGIFGGEEKDITKDQRQVGKVAILALGYQGSKGAFNSMAANYGVDLPTHVVEDIVSKWRVKNKNIVDFWYALERGATKAIKNKGKRVIVGPVLFRFVLGHLWCKIPSGRALCFPMARMSLISKPWGAKDEGISYIGENSYTRRVERLSTYGGKICENITQAVARDLLAGAMLAVEDKGYQICMHIHDEIVAFMPEHGSLKELEKTMAIVPDWAKGLPLEAKGWQGKRFRK